MDSRLTRARITYAKSAGLRYTGHLDMQHLWERLFRRAHLAIEYSQGFHPQARIQQGCALPLGFASRCEILDVWLAEGYDIPFLLLSIQSASPPGLQVLDLIYVDLHEAALQTRVYAADYFVKIDNQGSPADIEDRVTHLLQLEHLPMTRKNKEYDLRPLIINLDLFGSDENGWEDLRMRLSSRPGATGRPDEVLRALDLDPFSAEIERIQLFY